MSEIKLFGYSSETGEFDDRYLRRPQVNIIKCCYCKTILNEQNKTRDHIHPKILGGTVTRPCCYACNQEKGKLTLPRYILWLEERKAAVSSKTDEWRKRNTQIINAEKLLKFIVNRS